MTSPLKTKFQIDYLRSTAGQGISDPLSACEGALIARSLFQQEIGRDLAIAPETVKSHVKHIFRKAWC
jgi:DNA-binding NarL/FixJ family response regulator